MKRVKSSTTTLEMTADPASLLRAIASAQALYVQDEPPRKIFEALLTELLKIAGCEYGFIGEIVAEESSPPYLRTRAISNIAWNDETRAFFAQYEAEGLSFRNLDTLFGEVIRSGLRLISNNPAVDPRRGGLPSGHPAMHCFLGEPLMLGPHQVGMVGLANRPGGFDDAFVDSLQPLFSTCAQLIQSCRVESLRRTALEKAVATSDRLNALLNTATDAVFVLDEDGCISASNPSACRLFGASEAQLAAQGFSSLLAQAPDGDAPMLLRKLSDATADHGPKKLLFKRQSGNHFLGSVSVGRALSNGTIAYSVIVRDEGEREAQEQHVRLRAKAISEAALDCVIMIDEAGLVIDYNQAAAETFQYSAEEAMGRSLADLIIPPHLRDAHHRGMSHFLATGEGPILGKRIQVTAMRKDGTMFPTELAVVATRVNEQSMFTAYLRDISDRLARQQATERAAAEFNAVLELSANGFLVFSDASTCSFVNEAFLEMTGLQRDQLLNQSIGDIERLFVEHCGPKTSAISFHGLEDGEMAFIEWVRPSPTVAKVTCRSLASAGQPTGGLVLYFQDVTHETEVDRMKSEFLATAAHELRTPLASIQGYSELLMLKDFDAATKAQAIKTIFRQASSMTAMVNELLDISRIEARRGQDLQIRRHLVRELLEEIIQGFRPPEGRSPPALTVDDPSKWVMADRQKLGQAIINLLSNAYKYSPGGGPVIVRAELINDTARPKVCISVSDIGIGIPAHLTERVFKPFYRVDSSSPIPGTGLGLALVKEIIQLHEGDVSIVSWPNAGTTVKVTLPAVTDHSTGAMQ